MVGILQTFMIPLLAHGVWFHFKTCDISLYLMFNLCIYSGLQLPQCNRLVDWKREEVFHDGTIWPRQQKDPLLRVHRPGGALLYAVLHSNTHSELMGCKVTGFSVLWEMFSHRDMDAVFYPIMRRFLHGIQQMSLLKEKRCLGHLSLFKPLLSLSRVTYSMYILVVQTYHGPTFTYWFKVE